jgi:hypothetical protein
VQNVLPALLAIQFQVFRHLLEFKKNLVRRDGYATACHPTPQHLILYLQQQKENKDARACEVEATQTPCS